MMTPNAHACPMNVYCESYDVYTHDRDIAVGEQPMLFLSQSTVGIGGVLSLRLTTSVSPVTAARINWQTTVG